MERLLLTAVDTSASYEQLNIDSATLISVGMIILGIGIGLIIASFFAVFNKQTLGKVVRTLLENDAVGEENAKTLEEIGLEESMIARFSVTKSTNVRRVVMCKEEQAFVCEQSLKFKEYIENKEKNKKVGKFKEIPYRVNPYADAFYIPAELKYAAEAKFNKKGSTWLGACIFTVVMIAVLTLILLTLPQILAFINENLL